MITRMKTTHASISSVLCLQNKCEEKSTKSSNKGLYADIQFSEWICAKFPVRSNWIWAQHTTKQTKQDEAMKLSKRIIDSCRICVQMCIYIYMYILCIFARYSTHVHLDVYANIVLHDNISKKGTFYHLHANVMFQSEYVYIYNETLHCITPSRLRGLRCQKHSPSRGSLRWSRHEPHWAAVGSNTWGRKWRYSFRLKGKQLSTIFGTLI